MFSPTGGCNLTCRHCDVRRSGDLLPIATAEKFLKSCAKAGIGKVGFTGGEPFLATDFLVALTKTAVELGFTFDRIMTNGVWWRDRKMLITALTRLHDAGYDGSICVSFDAFHRQNIRKVAQFIKSAAAIWRRPDIVSIAYVTGARLKSTKTKLDRLTGLLKDRDICINLLPIKLSSIGKAAGLAKIWTGRWFKDDFCLGPGNALFVLPDGSVKPCCGFANEQQRLTIGNIARNTAQDIIKRANKNPFVYTVYNSGLSGIRKRLERSGFKFPGKTEDLCYFCRYLITAIPKRKLDKCLDPA